MRPRSPFARGSIPLAAHAKATIELIWAHAGQKLTAPRLGQAVCQCWNKHPAWARYAPRPGKAAFSNQSINQSINQPINQSIHQSINPSIHPSHQSISPSIHQSINQSLHQSINQSINQPLRQPSGPAISQSIAQSINRPMAPDSFSQSLYEGRAVLPPLGHSKTEWTHWDLNPGPSTCEADVIPLHHVPLKWIRW